MELEGGCLCGAVRYTFSGDVLLGAICHCRDCQRASGSAFHIGMVVPRKGLTITQGELRTYRHVGESGRWIDRSFCPICGSGILHELERRGPDVVVIKAGTFDDPRRFTPNREIFVQSKLPWVVVNAQTEQREGMGGTPPGR
jgi:hypothetical protein